MGVPQYSAVATPELIGVLAWWGVVLLAPLLLLRRWRARRRGGDRQRAVAPGAGGGALRPRERDRAVAVRPFGEPQSRARGVGASAWPDGTLAPLCRYVDFARRLEVAVCELRRRLSMLPADHWRVEPYPLTGERRNTLLVLGETGVFVISATLAPGHFDDLVTVHGLARKIESLLPGYPGDVRPAICHPFSSVGARVWHRDGGSGEWIAGWLVGGDSVIDWIEQFGTEHGLGPGDLEWFDVLSEPNWLRPAIDAPRTWPPVPDGARSCPRG